MAAPRLKVGKQQQSRDVVAGLVAGFSFTCAVTAGAEQQWIGYGQNTGQGPWAAE